MLEAKVQGSVPTHKSRCFGENLKQELKVSIRNS